MSPVWSWHVVCIHLQCNGVTKGCCTVCSSPLQQGACHQQGAGFLLVRQKSSRSKGCQCLRLAAQLCCAKIVNYWDHGSDSPMHSQNHRSVCWGGSLKSSSSTSHVKRGYLQPAIALLAMQCGKSFPLFRVQFPPALFFFSSKSNILLLLYKYFLHRYQASNSQNPLSEVNFGAWCLRPCLVPLGLRGSTLQFGAEQGSVELLCMSGALLTWTSISTGRCGFMGTLHCYAMA